MRDSFEAEIAVASVVNGVASALLLIAPGITLSVQINETQME
jgi:hypothetical protein